MGMMGTTPPRLRPPWLRILLVVAVVWLGVALVHGVNFALAKRCAVF